MVVSTWLWRAWPRACMATLLCLASVGVQAQTQKLPNDDVETALVGIFKAIEGRRLAEALARTEALIASRPNYRLAHLIKIGRATSELQSL